MAAQHTCPVLASSQCTLGSKKKKKMMMIQRPSLSVSRPRMQVVHGGVDEDLVGTRTKKEEEQELEAQL